MVRDESAQDRRMGNRVILWGLCLCLVLLLMVLSGLAAAGNWVAVSATLASLGGVGVATFVVLRPRRGPRQRLR